MIAYSMEHPGAAARLFKEFAKANAKFEVKAAAFEGELILVFSDLTAWQLCRPTKKQLHA